MSDMPPRPEPTEAEELRRRRRGVNWAVLLVLIALSVLFFLITIAKMTKA